MNPADLATELIDWYRQGHRRLPWRETRDPYRVWISEVMLQQTQVKTVLPYYERFFEAFPTIEALARAPIGRVMKIWEGLGYYARCRNLHRAAGVIVEQHGGRFPTTLGEVLALPGVGRSTAGGILTFAMGQRHPILDGNIKRVLSRLADIDQPVTRSPIQKRLWRYSTEIVEAASDAAAVNQALMELGATVCTPRQPRCPDCPVAHQCLALRRGTVDDRPVGPPRRRIPHHHIAVGVIWHDGKILIQQRPAEGLLGGLWEFPGGKQEAGEALAGTVAREIREELGLAVDVGRRFAEVDHAYSHFRVTLHAYHCTYRGGRPESRASQQWRWVGLDDLDEYAFPKANRRLLEILRSPRNER